LRLANYEQIEATSIHNARMSTGADQMPALMRLRQPSHVSEFNSHINQHIDSGRTMLLLAHNLSVPHGEQSSKHQVIWTTKVIFPGHFLSITRLYQIPPEVSQARHSVLPREYAMFFSSLKTQSLDERSPGDIPC